MNEIMNINGVECYEENGVAYLNLEAVARGLGFTKKAESGNDVVNWTRVRGYLADLGVVQKCTTGDYIPENIFYRLAMKAKNETAERFQALVADEVIPSIRKHGAYLTTAAAYEFITRPESIIEMCQNWKADREKLQEATLRLKEANEQRERDAPKVLFADSVAASKSEILVGELAKILKQNGVDIGQNRLFEQLRKDGYLINRKGCDWNMPTQRSLELGVMRIKETSVTHADGHVTVSKTPKVTGKGQLYFVNRYSRA